MWIKPQINSDKVNHNWKLQGLMMPYNVDNLKTKSISPFLS